MGETVTGYIDPAGHTDFWSFEGNTGDVIIITMEASQERTLDPYIELLDSTGYREAFDNDTGPGFNARISKRLAKTGLYTIAASSSSGTSIGHYVLTLTSAAYLPALPFGQTISGTIDVQGFSKLYTFPGAFGQNVIITAEAAAGSQLTPYIELLNPDGLLEANGSVPTTTTVNSRIAKLLSSTGPYIVIVSDYWATTTGGYNLGLISPTAPTATATPVATAMATTTATPSPVQVSIGLASIDGKYTAVWHFDAATGFWKFYKPSDPASATLTQLEPWGAYWINVTDNCTLTVGGSSIPLYKGWNMVGWSK